MSTGNEIELKFVDRRYRDTHECAPLPFDGEIARMELPGRISTNGVTGSAACLKQGFAFLRGVGTDVRLVQYWFMLGSGEKDSDWRLLTGRNSVKLVQTGPYPFFTFSEDRPQRSSDQGWHPGFNVSVDPNTDVRKFAYLIRETCTEEFWEFVHQNWTRIGLAAQREEKLVCPSLKGWRALRSVYDVRALLIRAAFYFNFGSNRPHAHVRTLNWGAISLDQPERLWLEVFADNRKPMWQRRDRRAVLCLRGRETGIVIPIDRQCKLENENVLPPWVKQFSIAPGSEANVE